MTILTYVFNTLKNIIGLVRVRAWPSFIICFLGGLSFSGNSLITLIQSLLNSRLYISIVGFILLLAYTFALNQCFDIKEDSLHKEKKQFPVTSGRMTLSRAIMWTILLLVGGSIAMFFTSTSPATVLLYIFIWTAYSIPKLRFKERMGLDLVSNGAGGGLSFLLGASILSSIGMSSIFIASVIALMYGTGYIFHSCADYENDKLANVKTTCVRIGKKKSLILAVTILAMMAIFYTTGILLLPFPKHYLALAIFLVPLLLIVMRVDVNNTTALEKLQKRVIFVGYATGITAIIVSLLFILFNIG